MSYSIIFLTTAWESRIRFVPSQFFFIFLDTNVKTKFYHKQQRYLKSSDSSTNFFFTANLQINLRFIRLLSVQGFTVVLHFKSQSAFIIYVATNYNSYFPRR